MNVDLKFSQPPKEGKGDFKGGGHIKFQMTDLEKLLHKLNIDEEKRSISGVFSVELEAWLGIPILDSDSWDYVIGHGILAGTLSR